MGKHQTFTQLEYVKDVFLQLDGEVHAFNLEMPGGGKVFMNAQTGLPYQYVDPETGERRLPLPADEETLLAEGRLKPLFMAPTRNTAVETAIDVDVAAIIQKDRAAQGRQLILRLYDESPVRLSNAALERFLDDNKEEIYASGLGVLPNASTVRRWLKRRGGFGDRPLEAMVSMSGRVPRKRSFEPPVEAEIARALTRYWGSKERTPSEVRDEVQDFVDKHNRAFPNEKWMRPSDETIRTRLRQSETGALFKQKFGDKAFRQKYRTPRDRRLHATQILETAIVDHTVVDTMLVVSARDRTPFGRPTLALMVDVASRAILAWYITFDKPSLHTVTQLLKRSLRPKPHLRSRFPENPDGAGIFGKASAIVYDRALESIGVSHRDALADLGIEVVYAGAGQPQAKGIVERLFRRLNELLFHRLPGSVSLPASLMRDMGYDPAKTCVVTLEELEELIEEAINVYHYEWHEGISGSPIKYWIDQGKRVHTLPDVDILDKMMGVTVIRTLDRSGIRLNHLQYCCETNVPILLDGKAASERTKRGKRRGSVTSTSKVKYNPEDISQAFVLNESDNQYYELRCTDPYYVKGTSLWQHREIRKYAIARHLEFRTPEQRREARLALARSIEEASPEIGLKGKRAQKRLRDAFFGEVEFEQCGFESNDEFLADVIYDEPAAQTRMDGGVPLHSPQRGKTARKRNAAKRKPRAAKVKTTPVSAGLVTMTEELRAAEAAGWRTN